MASSKTMWVCYRCHDEFTSTLGAIEHRIRNADADIWPYYGGDE